MKRLSTWQLAVVIALIGATWLLSLRFILADLQPTHYHADFAIYINGQQDELARFSFYEETTACALGGPATPQSRVHLHDYNATVVHVHDDAVTWGHLLANLGYSLSNSGLTTDGGIFNSNQSDSLRFVLNGKQVWHVANRIIGDQDVLLIDYGDDGFGELVERHNSIPRGAMAANQADDPATCSGSTGESILSRIQRTLFGSN